MAIIRWNPTREVTRMERDLRRMMRDFEQTSEEPSSMAVWVPPVDIYETDNEIVVRADVSGIDPKDLDIRIENNVLTMKGERRMQEEVKEDTYHRIESAYGTFMRSFTLPAAVEEDQIKAEYKDGVLKITLPKKEQAKPKQIKVA